MAKIYFRFPMEFVIFNDLLCLKNNFGKSIYFTRVSVQAHASRVASTGIQGSKLLPSSNSVLPQDTEKLHWTLPFTGRPEKSVTG